MVKLALTLVALLLSDLGTHPPVAHATFTGDINAYADRCACELGGGNKGYMPTGVMPDHANAQEIPVFWNTKRVTYEQTAPGLCIEPGGVGTDCTSDGDCPDGSCGWEYLFAGLPGVAVPKRCNGGGNANNPCTTASECPGGAGCSRICAGGANENAFCTVDTQCTGGACGGYPDSGNTTGRIAKKDFLKCDYFSLVDSSCVPGQKILQIAGSKTCVGGNNAGGDCLSNAACPGGTCDDVLWSFVFRRSQPLRPGQAFFDEFHPYYFRTMDVSGYKLSTKGVCWFDTLVSGGALTCFGGANAGMPCETSSSCGGGVCRRGLKCAGGANEGNPCTVASECPGSECLGGLTTDDWWNPGTNDAGIPRPGGRDAAKKARAKGFWDTPEQMSSGDCTRCHGVGPIFISRWLGQALNPAKATRVAWEAPYWNGAALLPNREFFKPTGAANTCASSCHGHWSRESRTCPGTPFVEAMTSDPKFLPLASDYRKQAGIAPASQAAGVMFEMPHPFNDGTTPADWEDEIRGPYVAMQPCCRVCNGGPAHLDVCSSNADCRTCVGGDKSGSPCTAQSDCPGAGGGCPPACVGGSNAGAPCSNPSECPGSTLGCVDAGICEPPRTCVGGAARQKLSCASNADCRVCVGGTSDGLLCEANSACPGGTCPAGGNCAAVAPAATCTNASTAVVPNFFGPQDAAPAAPSQLMLPPDPPLNWSMTKINCVANPNGSETCDVKLMWDDPANPYQAPDTYYLEPAVGANTPGGADPPTPPYCPTELAPGDTTTPLNACLGGPNEGAICTVASECPSGTCPASTWRQHHELVVVAGMPACIALTVRLCGERCAFGARSKNDGEQQTTTVRTACAAPAPEPISGAKLLIKDNADATKRKVIFQSKDPSIDTSLASGIDPAADGALLQIYNANGGGDSVCLGLPQTGWFATGASTPVYKYKDTTSVDGPCKVARIKGGKFIKVTCQAKVEPIGYSLDEATQVSVGVNFTSGTTKYCTVFGGTIKQDSGVNPPNFGGKGQFVAKDAPEPMACPVAPPCP